MGLACPCVLCRPRKACGHSNDLLCGCGITKTSIGFTAAGDMRDWNYIGRHRPEYVRPKE